MKQTSGRENLDYAACAKCLLAFPTENPQDVKIIAEVLTEHASMHGKEELILAPKNTHRTVPGLKRILFASVAPKNSAVSLMSTSLAANVKNACMAVF